MKGNVRKLREAEKFHDAVRVFLHSKINGNTKKFSFFWIVINFLFVLRLSSQPVSELSWFVCLLPTKAKRFTPVLFSESSRIIFSTDQMIRILRHKNSQITRHREVGNHLATFRKSTKNKDTKVSKKNNGCYTEVTYVTHAVVISLNRFPFHIQLNCCTRRWYF